MNNLMSNKQNQQSLYKIMDLIILHIESSNYKVISFFGQIDIKQLVYLTPIFNILIYLNRTVAIQILDSSGRSAFYQITSELDLSLLCKGKLDRLSVVNEQSIECNIIPFLFGHTLRYNDKLFHRVKDLTGTIIGICFESNYIAYKHHFNWIDLLITEKNKYCL